MANRLFFEPSLGYLESCLVDDQWPYNPAFLSCLIRGLIVHQQYHLSITIIAWVIQWEENDVPCLSASRFTRDWLVAFLVQFTCTTCRPASAGSCFDVIIWAIRYGLVMPFFEFYLARLVSESVYIYGQVRADAKLASTRIVGLLQTKKNGHTIRDISLRKFYRHREDLGIAMQSLPDSGRSSLRYSSTQRRNSIWTAKLLCCR